MKNQLLSRVSLVSALTLAIVCPKFSSADSSEFENLTKERNARRGDVASKYVLYSSGDFFRIVRGKKCQITNRVRDFKISHHPRDAAMTYYIKSNGDLMVLNNPYGAELRKPCPKAVKVRIMTNTRKYNVIPNTKTTIVNVALSRTGRMVAWDNIRAVFSHNNTRDYQVSPCFGAKGRSFSSYAIFAINYQGSILKVKGRNPGSSKWDYSRRYRSISDFKRANKVCQ